MTHWQYLEEPWESVQWMVHIDDLVREQEAKQQRG